MVVDEESRGEVACLVGGNRDDKQGNEVVVVAYFRAFQGAAAYLVAGGMGTGVVGKSEQTEVAESDEVLSLGVVVDTAVAPHLLEVGQGGAVAWPQEKAGALP